MTTPHRLRVLMLLAMLFASFSMVGGGHAMAAAATSVTAEAGHSGGHCADMGDKKPTPNSPSIDCMIACAALPSATPLLDHREYLERPRLFLPGSIAADGLVPEADPPPPRVA